MCVPLWLHARIILMVSSRRNEKALISSALLYRDTRLASGFTRNQWQWSVVFLSDISYYVLHYVLKDSKLRARHAPVGMMRTGRILIVSAVVALFGVVSAVLGFVAEATRLKPDDIGVTRSGCVYPANPAFVVALCAAFLLAVAQIVASAAGGWCGCCRPGTTGFRAPKSKRFLGIVASILSWIAALIAIAFYLQGAAWNAPVARGGAAGGCYYLRPGVFRRAAVLSLVAAALGIASYVLLTRRRPSAMAAAAGYAPKPDVGHHPPAAVEMQQGPYGHQGYGQQPAYPPPAAAQAGPYGHRQEYGQQSAYPAPAAQAAGPYGGQAPPNTQYDPPPAATGQGHAYADV